MRPCLPRRNFTEIKNLKVPDFVKILPDEGWSEVLPIAKEIVPLPNLRIPHNKRTLAKLMETHGILNGDEVLETALRFAKTQRRENLEKTTFKAVKFLNSEVLPTKNNLGSIQLIQ